MLLTLLAVIGVAVLAVAFAAGLTVGALVAGAALAVICVLSAIARLGTLLDVLEHLD